MIRVGALHHILLELTPLHVELYHTLARQLGGWEGVSLSSFVLLADAFTPQLARSRVDAVFIESLPIAELYDEDSPKLLEPHAFQEALLRLAMLKLDAESTRKSTGKSTGADSMEGLVGAELSYPAAAMGQTQMASLHASLQAMKPSALEAQASAKKKTITLERYKEVTAAMMIQKYQRGSAARSRNA